jgi:hypothetical protein|tara:strand:+ start:2754 stop:2912 length:159 start_codon:yes stop_codon:yes gene_type:complete
MKDKKIQAQPEKVDMVSIPVDVLNEALQYLAEKPYKEVFQIINSIQTQSKNI